MLLSTQGPFPPPALPGFSGTTDPSATLTARPAPRGVPVDVCRISPRASRVAAFFPFHACQRHYPDGSGSVPASLSSPSANGLPLKTGGSASVLSVSRPARRSLAFRPACSLSRPWRPLTPECFRPFRYLHDPPWLLPTGATVVGRGSHPPEEGAFPRRTVFVDHSFSVVSGKSRPRPPRRGGSFEGETTDHCERISTWRDSGSYAPFQHWCPVPQGKSGSEQVIIH